MQSTQMTTDEEVSVGWAAKRLGRHYITVQTMCREKRLDARKIGGKGPWLIRLSSVVAVAPKPDDAPADPPSPAKPPADAPPAPKPDDTGDG